MHYSIPCCQRCSTSRYTFCCVVLSSNWMSRHFVLFFFKGIWSSCHSHFTSCCWFSDNSSTSVLQLINKYIPLCFQMVLTYTYSTWPVCFIHWVSYMHPFPLLSFFSHWSSCGHVYASSWCMTMSFKGGRGQTEVNPKKRSERSLFFHCKKTITSILQMGTSTITSLAGDGCCVLQCAQRHAKRQCFYRVYIEPQSRKHPPTKEGDAFLFNASCVRNISHHFLSKAFTLTGAGSI